MTSLDCQKYLRTRKDALQKVADVRDGELTDDDKYYYAIQVFNLNPRNFTRVDVDQAFRELSEFFHDELTIGSEVSEEIIIEFRDVIYQRKGWR